MSEVAKQISKQLNYKVLMSDELASIKVFGNFNNITLQKFFSRNIFQKKNIVVLYDNEHQTVTISNFGSKQKVSVYNATTVDTYHTSTTNDIDPETEISPDVELAEMEIPEDSENAATIEVSPGDTIAENPETDENGDSRDNEIIPENKIADMPAIEETDHEEQIESE